MVEFNLRHEEDQVQENNHKEHINGSHFLDKETSREPRPNGPASKVTDSNLANKVFIVHVEMCSIQYTFFYCHKILKSNMFRLDMRVETQSLKLIP